MTSFCVTQFRNSRIPNLVFNCATSPKTNFVSINNVQSFAILRAVEYERFVKAVVIWFLISRILSNGTEQKNFSKSISIRYHVNFLERCHMDFLLFTMKLEFFTTMDFLKAVSEDSEIAKPSSRKHTIRTLFILQNFNRQFMTFVNTNSADVSPKGSTVNTKYPVSRFTLDTVYQEKPKKVGRGL